MGKQNKLHTSLLGERLYLNKSNEEAALKAIELGVDSGITPFVSTGGVVVAIWVNKEEEALVATLRADDGNLQSFNVTTWLQAEPCKSTTPTEVLVD